VTYVEWFEAMRNEYTDIAGNPEGKGPLGRPVRRWNNIKMDLG
jgi:hypothetical protein